MHAARFGWASRTHLATPPALRDDDSMVAFLGMIFWGWGQSHKQWGLPDGRIVFVSWRYFHLFWICCFAWGAEWYLLGDKRSEDQRIFKSTARELTGIEKLDIPLLDRFGGVACIAAIVLLNLFV